MELVGISTVTAIEGTPSGIDPGEVVAIAERTASRCGPLLARLVSAAGLHHEGVVEQSGEGAARRPEER